MMALPKLRTRAASPTRTRATWTRIHAFDARGSSARSRSPVGRPSPRASTTGNTKALKLVRPWRRSTHRSRSTATQITRDTTSARVRTGTLRSSRPRSTMAAVWQSQPATVSSRARRRSPSRRHTREARAARAATMYAVRAMSKMTAFTARAHCGEAEATCSARSRHIEGRAREGEEALPVDVGGERLLADDLALDLVHAPTPDLEVRAHGPYRAMPA